MTRSSGKPPTQRQLRVGEQLRHQLSTIVNAGHARDPDLQGVNVTVSEVRVSPDLKNATAFVLPLGGQEVDPVVAALNRASAFFRKELGAQSDLRYTPRLSFQMDSSFDEAQRVEELLRRERVRRDLDDSETARADNHETDEDGTTS
ncbi:30S ribosome-binding factor RbfA [Fodinicurvata sediminis]|uniref:30S ribosome-binding factor RbfA n=1 Tax=Fodinicurvata sediminis TaxID=1121832 RepID=UPI0003B4BC04|nr:30S ribosome-binding factor RbfA [Fodinicurvata sediminis]